MTTKRQKRTRNRRRLMMVVFGVLMLVAGVLVFLVVREINAPADDATENESQSSENDGINYDAPSDDEIQGGEEIKKEGQTEATNEGGDGGDGQVFIADASQYGDEVEVRARVDGVVQEGGTCRYLFETRRFIESLQPINFEKNQSGVADAKSTSCGTLIIPVGEFGVDGGWMVTVSYDGASSATAYFEVNK